MSKSRENKDLIVGLDIGTSKIVALVEVSVIEKFLAASGEARAIVATDEALEDALLRFIDMRKRQDRRQVQRHRAGTPAARRA